MTFVRTMQWTFRATRRVLGVHLPGYGGGSPAFARILQPSVRIDRHRRQTNPDDCHRVLSSFTSAALRNDTHTRRTGGANAGKIKPWLDVNKSVKTRHAEFIASDVVHPADFHAPEMVDLIAQCGKLRNLQGMNMAHSIVDRLLVEKKRLHDKGKLVWVPEKLWNKTLYGWVVLANDNLVARTRMNELMHAMLHEAKIDDGLYVAERARHSSSPQVRHPPSSRPTVDIFNTYLNGLSNVAKMKADAAQDAEQTLHEMLHLSQTTTWHVRPNMRSYAYVLSAYVNGRAPASGRDALRVLRQLEAQQQADLMQYEQQHGVPYNAMSSNNKRRIVAPDQGIYTLVLQALIRAGPPEESLRQLERWLQSGRLQPDVHVVTTMLDALAKRVDQLPDAKRRLATADQAVKVLTHLLEQAPTLAPSPSSSSPTGVHNLVAPCNATLNVLARTHVPEAAGRCEALLNDMLQHDYVVPDATSFNTCLYAWRNMVEKFDHDNVAPDRAWTLLQLQHELVAQNVLNEPARPDAESYATCILTLAYSNVPVKAVRARQVVERMMEQARQGQVDMHRRNAVAPFTATLTAVARSAAVPKGSTGADSDMTEFVNDDDTTIDPFDIAVTTYEQVLHNTHGMNDIVLVADERFFDAYWRCVTQHCANNSAERRMWRELVWDHANTLGNASAELRQALKDEMAV